MPASSLPWIVVVRLNLLFMQLTIITSDKRKMQLAFKAHIIEMGENILVDFRLSRVSEIYVIINYFLFLIFFAVWTVLVMWVK